MKYKATTTKTGVNRNGIEYPIDVLQEIAKQCDGKAVTLGVDGRVVGQVISTGVVENNKISMTLSISDSSVNKIICGGSLFAGSVGTGELNNNRQVTDFTLDRISLIDEHANDVPPLERIENE